MTYKGDMKEGPGRIADSVGGPVQECLTPAAFAVRFQSAWPTLWSIAVAVQGDPTGADDVLQEAAMIALDKLSQFDPDSNFTAWMGRIVRFVALNHGRRRANAPAASIDPHSLESEPAQVHATPDALLDGQGELIEGGVHFDDRVLAALRGLDETARACLLLRTLLNKSYREIALALDIAQGTAMSHVHRARTTLRERLTVSMPAPGDRTS